MKKTLCLSRVAMFLAGWVATGTCFADFNLDGADLLTDSNTTLSGDAGFTPVGTSIQYNGGPDNGIIRGIINDPTSGVSMPGSSYSVAVDVTQITSDTDFAWGVTDGVNVWGMLTFEGGVQSVTGPFNGLDGGTSQSTISGVSGPPGVGNSGTLIFDFQFDATSTTVSLFGDYYDSVTTNTFTDPTPFTFGNELSFLLISGGNGEVYQIDNINSTGIPEPSSAALMCVLIGGILVRRRK